MSVRLIALRDYRALFAGPVGWLVLCLWLFLVGFFWNWAVQIYVADSQDVVFNPYAASYLNFTDYLLAPFFGNLAVVLVLVMPALSMQSFALERSRHTLELLLTSPVSTLEIVLGKFLGGALFLLTLLGLSLPYPLTLYWWAAPDPAAIVGGFLGLTLLAAALLAMGQLFSALTSNQLVALFLTFTAGLALMLADGRGGDPDSLGAHLSLSTHLQAMLLGAVKLSDVAYFVVLTGFFLFAAHQRVEAYRWS